ncbi:hypothetical protein [Methanoculleus sp.]|uniref:hypothetical protein n=1 Tax=Methanoculleus sp. TaxID=90427 RepID=UPI0025DB9DCE|nr:hypothetical protein [Methanoculleus sp.]MCK9320112.1 hypothetical protein [Methanoculleus sp.]
MKQYFKDNKTNEKFYNNIIVEYRQYLNDIMNYPEFDLEDVVILNLTEYLDSQYLQILENYNYDCLNHEYIGSIEEYYINECLE